MATEYTAKAQLRIYETSTASEVDAKLYLDGGLSLKQGSDLVYLSAEQLAFLRNFITEARGNV
jgi:hypothetical protein